MSEPLRLVSRSPSGHRCPLCGVHSDEPMYYADGGDEPAYCVWCAATVPARLKELEARVARLEAATEKLTTCPRCLNQREVAAAAVLGPDSCSLTREPCPMCRPTAGGNP